MNAKLEKQAKKEEQVQNKIIKGIKKIYTSATSHEIRHKSKGTYEKLRKIGLCRYFVSHNKMTVAFMEGICATIDIFIPTCAGLSSESETLAEKRMQ